MKENKVVAMCPKCSKIDVFVSSSTNKRRVRGQKYELHSCPICGEYYLAHTFGYYSILRFHGDNYIEQMESILEITPEHCESFIQQVKDCTTEDSLLKIVQNMHGDVKPASNQEYEKMLDTSMLITEDLREQIEEV